MDVPYVPYVPLNQVVSAAPQLSSIDVYFKLTYAYYFNLYNRRWSVRGSHARFSCNHNLFEVYIVCMVYIARGHVGVYMGYMVYIGLPLIIGRK